MYNLDMASSQNLEERIANIEQRNKRVETDKAWEVSLTRKVAIAIFTYLAVALYMNAIGVGSPWLNAIIPTVGFLLSTLTLPFVKNFWRKYIHKD
jgi:sterol desaturase/sphingolipid hydroxylase (fatty acid hydroxylase superfamily)